MRKLILALVLCTFVCAHAGTHFHPKPNETVVPDELIIRLVPGADVRSVIASGNSSATGIGAAVSAISLFKSLRHGDMHVLKVPAGLREAIGDLLARLPGVEYVQANHVFTTTLVAPNDPGASSQWALQKVNAQQGWSLLPGQYLTASATGVNRPFVAVLDTGIDCTHPDFVNAGGTSDDSAAGGQLLFSAGQALVATSISPAACPWQDDFGHGTHVAGIVAASANNATGVVGIGWPIQVAGFKVLDGSGKGDEATISNAIMAAADEGASVISLSLGGAGYSQSMQNAVEYAWDRNVLVVAAAGNDGSSEVFFPADAVHALAVAATDSNNVTASFSNYGAAVGISAPGVNVYSTLPTYTVALNGPNYGTLSGTSMATPHVSGLAGLLALGTPAANSAAVVQRIQQSATSSIANGGWDQHYGYGVVNVFGALSATPRASTQGSVVGQVTDGTGLIQTDASQKTYVSTGLPVAGAQVVLNGQSTTTDTNGYYRFAAVAPGTWPVSVSASGFASKTLSATVAAGADTVMPVMMQAAYGEFTGTVSDHGAPVAGAIVQALSGGLIVATAVADGSGNYQLWAPAGTYNLSASALSHYSGVVPGVVVAQGAPSTVNLTITALGTITGVVSDGAGHPVSGAQVTFTGPGGFTAGAVTNSNGQYSSVGLPSGSYQVTATATGLPTTIQSATVSPDTNTSLTLSAQNTIPPAVPTFAGSVQHTSDYVTPAQHLNKILWQTSINQNNSGAMGHYGAPLITGANTVIVPVKTASGFQVSAFNGSTGGLLYTLSTDYVLPNYNWFPVYQPVLVNTGTGTRLYYPGAGGTVYYIDNPDSSAHSAPVRLAFYGVASFNSNASGFTSTVFIDTPISADSSGNIFFGFRVQGTAPAPLSTSQSGFARIDSAGNGVYVLAGTATGDGQISRDSHNSAPALSNDQSTLYVVAKSGTTEYYGYLLGLDSATLATKYKVFLRDPRNGNGGGILDDSTASPMVAPDNDVYFGIFSNPDNGSRGFMLRFSSDLSVQKTPGAFGWDFTAAVVPASMVTAYTGNSPYLIFSKYNNYANDADGNGVDRIALLDPNSTQIDPHPTANNLMEMRELMTVIGVTPDSENPGVPNAVREWCINSPAVNPATHSIFTPSEDGHVYRWNLDTNSLSEMIQIGSGVGEPYVPTVIGPDGTIYALNGGNLYALGNVPGVGISVTSNSPDVRTTVAGQSLTFTATVTNTGPSQKTPTGTVTFQDTAFTGVTPNTTTLASNVVLSGGVATFTTSSLPAGSHFITAVYSGGNGFSAGSAMMAQNIHSSASTTQVAAAPNPAAPGQSVTFTATVTPAPAGSPPEEVLTFSEGSNVLAQVPVSSSGVASFSTAALSAGNHTITAAYPSDSLLTASSGNVVAAVNAAAPPVVISLTPSSGSGTSVTFSAVYSDPNGIADLSQVQLLVNSSVTAGNACYLSYYRQTNRLYLRSDAGTALLSPGLTPGAGTVSNSQCTLNGAGSSVNVSGNNITVNAAITFASSFNGVRNVYLYALGSGGNTGFIQKGTWTPSPTSGPPTVVSLSPSSGSGSSATFTAVYSDPNGIADLSQVQLLVNTGVAAANACYLTYYPQTNLLYLRNDAGTALLSPALTPGSGTVSNSQCTLNAAGSSAGVSGNNLTLNVSLTFSNSFVGAHNVYLYASGFSGQNSGFIQKGSWTPSAGAGPPTVVSVSPNSGSGTSVTFTAVYSDPNGVADLNQLQLLVNTGVSAANACYLSYYPQTNRLYLRNDAGTSLLSPALTPGSGTVSNSQCTLNGAGSSFSVSGNNVTLKVALSFSSSVVGAQNVYLYATGFSGQNSGFVQKGSWTPSAGVGPPSVVSLTPSNASGSSVTFTAVYSDPNGASDLSQVQFLVNTALTGSNACYVSYYPKTNLLYLRSDAGSALLSPALVPGGAGTVSNSQCTLNGAGSSFSISGNNLTLNVAVTFSGSFSGSHKVYLYATGFSGQSSGFVQKGSWAP